VRAFQASVGLDPDGDVGPLTRQALLKAGTEPPHHGITRPNDLRATIVQRAKAEYQKHVKETPAGSGCNPYTAYWKRGLSTGCARGTRKEAWCADFAGYIWKVAGANTAGLTAGAISFYTYGKRHGTFKTSNPQPGDVVVFNTTSDARHVGIVTAVNNPRSITMISGNYSHQVSSTTFDPTRRLGSDGPVLGYVSPT
jgi:uncharacterized protein (TIGR02594 family)